MFILDPLPFPLAGPLLEWAPLVLAAGNILEDVLSWGIKLDVVLAQAEQTERASFMLSSQAPVEIITLAVGESFLQRGLQFLNGDAQTDVNLLAVATEDTFAAVEKFKGALRVNIIEENLKWSIIPAGNFEKWITAGTLLRVRKSTSEQVLHLQGLQATAHEAFECARTGMVTIRTHGSFWVAEPL